MSASTQGAVQAGSWVVVDPTGRDLRDCYEVGCVLQVDHVSDAMRADGGTETYHVALNGGNQIVACTEIAAVLS